LDAIFDQLRLRKIITIVATRCQILRLECTKFDFGWGSAPDPAGGAYSAPPDPLAGFNGPTAKGGKGRGRGEGKGGEGRERRGEKGRKTNLPLRNPGSAPGITSKSDDFSLRYGDFTILVTKTAIFKNPRWRTAAILKIVKSPYLSEKSSDFDEIRHTTAIGEPDCSLVTKN